MLTKVFDYNKMLDIEHKCYKSNIGVFDMRILKKISKIYISFILVFCLFAIPFSVNAVNNTDNRFKIVTDIKNNVGMLSSDGKYKYEFLENGTVKIISYFGDETKPEIPPYSSNNIAR